MAESPNEVPPSEEPPVADYRGEPDRDGRAIRGFRRGFIFALAVGLICFGLLFVAGAETFEDSPAGAWSVVGLTVPPLALVGMLILAFRAKRTNARPGYAAGLFVGLGLSALPVGWCYAVVADSVMH